MTNSTLYDNICQGNALFLLNLQLWRYNRKVKCKY